MNLRLFCQVKAMDVKWSKKKACKFCLILSFMWIECIAKKVPKLNEIVATHRLLIVIYFPTYLSTHMPNFFTS